MQILRGAAALIIFLFPAGTHAPAYAQTEPAVSSSAPTAPAAVPQQERVSPFSFTFSADARKTDFSARYGLRFSNDDLKSALPKMLHVFTKPGDTLSALLSPLTPSGARRIAGEVTKNTALNLSGVQIRPYKVWVQIDYYCFSSCPLEPADISASSGTAAGDRRRYESMGTGGKVKLLLTPVLQDARDSLTGTLAEQAFDSSVGSANPSYRTTTSPGEKRKVVQEIWAVD